MNEFPFLILLFLLLFSTSEWWKWVIHTVWSHFLNLPPGLLMFLGMAFLNQYILNFLFKLGEGWDLSCFFSLLCKISHLRFISLSSDQHLTSFLDNSRGKTVLINLNKRWSQFFVQLPPYKVTAWRISGFRNYHTLTQIHAILWANFPVVQLQP